MIDNDIIIKIDINCVALNIIIDVIIFSKVLPSCYHMYFTINYTYRHLAFHRSHHLSSTHSTLSELVCTTHPSFMCF
jgi:hypothetical protein